MAAKFNYLAEAVKHAEFVLRKRPMELETLSSSEVKEYGELVMARIKDAVRAAEADFQIVHAVILNPADMYALSSYFGLLTRQMQGAQRIYDVPIQEMDVPMGYPVLSTTPKDHRGDSPLSGLRDMLRRMTVNEIRESLELDPTRPTDPTIPTR